MQDFYYSNMGTLAERLIEARQELKWSKADLRRAAGLKSASTLTELENGNRTESPQLPVIAAALGVEVLWLQHERGPKRRGQSRDAGMNVPEGAYHLKPSQEVPVVGTTQGGPPDRLWQELNYPVGYSDQFLEAATPDPHAYALRVVGNSMAPRIMEGEWLMVEPSAEAQPGFDVVVRTTEGAVMVKRLLSRHNDTILLESVNEAFQRITLMSHEIDFMHPIGGIFPPRAIKQRVGEAMKREEYKGPWQRVVAKPVETERRRYTLPAPMETEDRDYPPPPPPSGKERAK